MMARTHVATAAAVWFTAGVGLPALLGAPLSTAQVAAGGVVMATAGLLPDIDTDNSTFRYAFGAPGAGVTRFVGRIAGGHRHATHTLAFAVLAGAIGVALGGSRFFLLPLLAASAHVAVRLVVPKAIRQVLGATGRLLLAGIIAAVLAASAEPGPWVGWALLVGVLAHLAGDLVTGRGVPLLWPIRRDRMVLGPNGSGVLPINTRAERAVMWALAVCAVSAAWMQLAPAAAPT